jgi:hypothetical protein
MIGRRPLIFTFRRNEMRAIFCLLFLFFVIPLGTAATIYVPNDYTTIQAAINNASGGDRILVSAGTYDEDLIISGKNLVLESAGYRTATISGTGSAEFPKPVIKIQSCTVTVDGFVIRDGTGQYLEQALG